MKNDEHFWRTTLIRGFLALLTGSAIMVIPDMARSLLLLPLAIVATILCLAAYGVLDSVLIFITSYMAASRTPKIALRVQGAVGISVGILLYAAFFDHVQLHLSGSQRAASLRLSFAPTASTGRLQADDCARSDSFAELARHLSSVYEGSSMSAVCPTLQPPRSKPAALR